MISKFSRKRNVNTSLPFSNKLTYIDSKSGSNTFSFTKVTVSAPSGGDILNTESENRMTNELSQYLIAD